LVTTERSSQWFHETTADIDAPEAWDPTHKVTGARRYAFAVIDSGARHRHAGSWPRNFLDNLPGEIPGKFMSWTPTGNGYVDDVHRELIAISGTGDPADDDGHGDSRSRECSRRLGTKPSALVVSAWSVKDHAVDSFLAAIGDRVPTSRPPSRAIIKSMH
jgi:hypothetical protein